MCQRWHSQPSLWARARRSSTELVAKKIEGHGVRLLPRSGQPPEITLLKRGGLVALPGLSQEHPFTLHITLGIIPCGNITARYSIIFRNSVLL